MKRREVLRCLGAASATIAAPVIAQPKRLVLGQSAAFTGPAAQLGVQMNIGARLYLDALNASGGVNGQQIELRALDDGYEPDRCKANTQTLIKDDTFALLGYVGTPTCVAALPLVNEARIPFFGPFTGAEVLRDPFSRYVFHLRASYYQETAEIVKQLTTLGRNKIAVFYQNDSYGKAGLEGVQRALKQLNLAPVALGTVERNTVDVAQSVKDIVPHLPDAIVQISAYKSCAAFIRAARKAGFGGAFYNVSFVGTLALATELGAEGRGVVISQVMPFPFAGTTQISAEYLLAIQKASNGAVPNYSSIEGYLAAKVFIEGLRRAGRNASREAVIDALETIQNLSFGGYHVTFGPKVHTASRFVELTMLDESGRVRR